MIIMIGKRALIEDPFVRDDCLLAAAATSETIADTCRAVTAAAAQKKN